MKMRIHVVTGTGRGPTKLAAFDASLRSAGVADFNLVKVSSVIPIGATVTHSRKPRRARSDAQWGGRLYAVVCDCRVAEPNHEAWAGIAWWQAADGRGFFVEQEGESERGVRRDLVAGLRAMVCERSFDFDATAPKIAIAGITCESEPVCATAIAAYGFADWEHVKET
jgi:arginine decarboxylase